MKFVCRIGTNPSNDLVIHDRTAADFHAQLIMDHQNQVVIRDLDTRFGTRVNGIKVNKQELNPGDEIKIGFSSIDWQRIVNEWMLINESDLEEAREPVLEIDKNAESRLSLKLAEEAGKVRTEYLPEELKTESEKTTGSTLQLASSPPETPDSKEIKRTETEQVSSDEPPFKSAPATQSENKGLHEKNEDLPNPSSPLTETVFSTSIDLGSASVRVVPGSRVQTETPSKNKTTSWFTPLLLILAGVGLLVFAGYMLASFGK